MNRLLLFLMLVSITLCGQRGDPLLFRQKHGKAAHWKHLHTVSMPDSSIKTEKRSDESDDEGSDIHISAGHLPPGTSLGFHIYEKGTCQAPDFESAGGPFNPLNKEHGFNNPMGHHAGDLPILKWG